MLPVIICFSNYGYLDFATNFLKNVQSVLKNHQTVFYCLDDEIYVALKPFASASISIIKWESSLSKSYETYHTQGFKKIMHTKTNIIIDALELYNFIHFVDADVVFCKEPIEEYYQQYSEYDIVYQRDAPPPNEPFNSWTCAGNCTLKNTQGTRDFLKKIVFYEEKFSNKNDQECQCQLLKDCGCELDIRKYPGTKLYEYPMEEYCCGYIVKNNTIPLDSMMVFHANHVIGKSDKIKLLKKIGKWYN